MDFHVETSGHLTSLTAETADINILNWVRDRQEVGKFYLKLRDDPWEWGGAGNIFDNHEYSMAQAYSFVHSEDLPGLKIFVAHTFDLDPAKSYFSLPRYEICRDDKKTTLRINCWKNEDPQKFLPFNFNSPEVSALPITNNFSVGRSDNPSRHEWPSYFVSAQDFLRQHSKIVLARVTESKWNTPVDPFALLISLHQESYRCYLRLPSGQEIVSVSPERLFKIDGSFLKTEAVAGTRPRGGDPEEFLNCPKERAEHQYVVDEILKQIKPFCEKVEYPPTPEIAAFKKVLHLKTPVTARLKNHVSHFNLIEALHPTPAVGGLPKNQSVRWLENNEPFKREYYAAPVGFIGKNRAEFFVNIRSVLISGRDMKLYSGVGVVKESRADNEWEELDLKASQFWEALPS